MGNGMQGLTMIALAAHMLTIMVSIVITLWIIKILIPIYRPIFKQMKAMASSEEEEA